MGNLVTFPQPSLRSWSRHLGSPAPHTEGWLARICSTRVLPDRGRPTTKMGVSSRDPTLPAKALLRDSSFAPTGNAWTRALHDPRLLLLAHTTSAAMGHSQGPGLLWGEDLCLETKYALKPIVHNSMYTVPKGMPGRGPAMSLSSSCVHTGSTFLKKHPSNVREMGPLKKSLSLQTSVQSPDIAEGAQLSHWEAFHAAKAS